MKLLAGERNMYVVNEDHQARLQSDDKDEDDGGGDCDDDDDNEGNEEKEERHKCAVI